MNGSAKGSFQGKRETCRLQFRGTAVKLGHARGRPADQSQVFTGNRKRLELISHHPLIKYCPYRQSCTYRFILSRFCYNSGNTGYDHSMTLQTQKRRGKHEICRFSLFLIALYCFTCYYFRSFPCCVFQ